MNEKMDQIKKIVSDGHQWIIDRIELHVGSAVSDTMYKKTAERSKIEVMLYNFVDGEIPASVRKLFDEGMDSVPSTRMTKREVDKRVEEALLEYLVRLGRRRICGNAVLQPNGIQDWIDNVKKINIDQESRNFLERLEETIPALKTELDLVYCDMDLDTKEEMVEKLEKDGCY